MRSPFRLLWLTLQNGVKYMSKLYLEIKSEELKMKRKNLNKSRGIWFNAKIGPGSRNLSPYREIWNIFRINLCQNKSKGWEWLLFSNYGQLFGLALILLETISCISMAEVSSNTSTSSRKTISRVWMSNPDLLIKGPQEQAQIHDLTVMRIA